MENYILYNSRDHVTTASGSKMRSVDLCFCKQLRHHVECLIRASIGSSSIYHLLADLGNATITVLEIIWFRILQPIGSSKNKHVQYREIFKGEAAPSNSYDSRRPVASFTYNNYSLERLLHRCIVLLVLSY